MNDRTDKSNSFVSIIGSKVVISTFLRKDVTEEYVSWLNDLDVVAHSNQRFLNHTIESCLKYLKTFAKSSNLFLKIQLIGTSRGIGTMTVFVNENHQVADVGILIGVKSLWGGGIGQDAWITVQNWLIGEYGIRKVTGGAQASNIAMVRIFEKAGMSLEGIRIAQEISDSKIQDIVLYGYLR